MGNGGSKRVLLEVTPYVYIPSGQMAWSLSNLAGNQNHLTGVAVSLLCRILTAAASGGVGFPKGHFKAMSMNVHVSLLGQKEDLQNQVLRSYEIFNLSLRLVWSVTSGLTPVQGSAEEPLVRDSSLSIQSKAHLSSNPMQNVMHLI